MTDRIVHTQEELDTALREGVDWIEIRSNAGVWIEVTASGSATVTASGSATVTASGSATVRAYDSATVRASGSATVTASGSATVTALGSATVRAYDSATVTALDSATVTASGSATVTASGSATVTALGSATVRAYDSATVTALDSATVRASGSATVRAYDSATVRASGSATVTASGSATVTALGSATVRAYDSATVTALDSATVRAYDSATVRASSHVAVHLHSGRARIEGGVLIDHQALDLHDPKAWCDYHGVEVVDGVARVYKAVDDKWTTPRGAVYAPGATPSAPDWEDSHECGGGLHFGPTPGHSLAYHDRATRFVRVGVALATLRPILGGTAKCKAPAVVEGCVEVDINGVVKDSFDV